MVTADQKLASSANLLAMLGGKQTAFIEHLSGLCPHRCAPLPCSRAAASSGREKSQTHSFVWEGRQSFCMTQGDKMADLFGISCLFGQMR